ncbi:TIGR01906 family membrane protein [Clostridium sp. C8]|uniref:TIGR01906 family membrane protein n=1 Tax=Clostridium sp. C8 TaxID=1667357 RepID=UPI00062E4458|nr:TIGR01906 family membrane protein [Clostridium sp. C8]KLE16130.1 integral membrane protein [Clostridium sp. C8]
MKKWINCIFKVLQGISIALFTIGISVIASLNLRSIYKYSIQKYDLDKIGQLSKEKLMEDYNILLNYLQNPFAKKLKFNNFIMSSNGEFHFYEVKKIFLSIYLIVLIFVLIFIVIYLIKKYNNKKIKLIKSLNYGANALISIITVLLTSIFIDFSKAFIIFHKIFFNNEYWIFDSKTDPIINVLPEEVFKLYALVVIIFTLIAIIVYKTIYISYNKHSKLN